MLNTDRQQSIGLDHTGLALGVQRPHMHGIKPLHPVINARHRQAAFFVQVLFGAGPDQLGVDQHQGLIALLRHVDDHQPLMHIHLGGRQANAVRVVHRGQHVGHQRADAVVHRLDGAGDLVKPGVRVTENGKDCHGCR